jgi:hypothetical protein
LSKKANKKIYRQQKALAALLSALNIGVMHLEV